MLATSYHEEWQLLPYAEIALAGQLEDLRDEMQALKDDLLGQTGEGIAAAVAVLLCLGRHTHASPLVARQRPLASPRGAGGIVNLTADTRFPGISLDTHLRKYKE